MTITNAGGLTAAIRVTASGVVFADTALVTGVQIEAPGSSGFWEFHEAASVPTLTSEFTASSSSGLLLTWSAGASWGVGLRTGHRVRLANPTPANLPANTASSTDYWTIYISATTAKLATTYANAIAGNAIAYGGSGTGPHSILWPLQQERRQIERKYDTVKAGDLITFCDGPSRFRELYMRVPTGGIAHVLVNPN